MLLATYIFFLLMILCAVCLIGFVWYIHTAWMDIWKRDLRGDQ